MDSRSSAMTDEVRAEPGESRTVAAGTEATHKIRVLQTPLHDVTVGSGCSERTQTCARRNL